MKKAKVQIRLQDKMNVTVQRKYSAPNIKNNKKDE
jgi:hypothetical protein